VNFKAGDVIVFSTDGANPLVDWFINLVSKKTHVGMFINEREFIEATNPAGVRRNTFNPKWNYAKVYRPPEWVDQSFIDRAVEMSLIHIGDKYSVFQGVYSGVLRMFNMAEMADKIDRNWNCSEFIGYLLRYGMQLNFILNVALQSILPDDLEGWMVNNKWQIIL